MPLSDPHPISDNDDFDVAVEPALPESCGAYVRSIPVLLHVIEAIFNSVPVAIPKQMEKDVRLYSRSRHSVLGDRAVARRVRFR